MTYVKSFCKRWSAIQRGFVFPDDASSRRMSCHCAFVVEISYFSVKKGDDFLSNCFIINIGLPSTSQISEKNPSQPRSPDPVTAPKRAAPYLGKRSGSRGRTRRSWRWTGGESGSRSPKAAFHLREKAEDTHGRDRPHLPRGGRYCWEPMMNPEFRI